MDTAAQTRADDEALLTRWRRGDVGALDELFRAHRSAVYAVARRMLGRNDGAEDATQETLYRAWRAADGFRGDASFRTWILRIAVNVVRTRGRGRPPEVGLEAAANLPAVARDAEADLERVQARRRVRAAVDRLPPRQREVILLKVYSDLSYEEAAAVLGLSVGAVKAHVHQATANLRRILSKREA